MTQPVSVGAAQVLTLPPFRLSLQTVAISVDAITAEQAGVEQVRTEEHQRLAGVLPNFFVSYTWTAQPLTAKQKYRLATHTVFDPGNLALAGLVAGVQQADDAFPGYGQGAAGYSKRFGADLANLAIGTYLGGAVLPSLFHQDPRYFYKGTGTKKSRFVYAVSRAVITRGDNGHQQPNFSGILGDLSAGAISNLYYPASDRQGATLFVENSILGIAGDALTDFVQEFIFSRFTLDTRTRKAAAKP
ncbi:MAG: carboxypeptidase regulatory-like domain-containing protein [Rhodospirillales bacterium]|nr:carboxypeptidase regulatory-like domain-containing protein [Acetobacter sp.]